MLPFAVLLILVPRAFGASCGGSGIPFRFEVLPSGAPVLGCAAPSCFGGGDGGNGALHDSKFQLSPEGDDGFFREGDLQRSRSRLYSAAAQQALCPSGFDSQSCNNERTWVGGFLASPDGSLRLQCCSYDGLRFAEEVGRPIVHSGEVYSGGEVLRDGRQTGFDLISNVKRIDASDGNVAYELTVVRMNCLPDPAEPTNDVDIDTNEISRILDKVGDVRAQEPAAIAQVGETIQQRPDSYQVAKVAEPAQVEDGEEIVQVGEQVIPVTSAGYYYPVASGVPACFTGDTQVETPSGYKRMDELKIGDLVLTAERNSTLFTRVISFLHRLPSTAASFIKVESDEITLKLTPQHFIYKVDCDNADYNIEMVYAEDLKAGDCLYRAQADSLHKTFVHAVSIVQERGVYAPMTESGDLLANDIYVSCHNVVKSNTLAHTYLGFVTAVQRKMRSLFGGADNGHLPTTTEFFLNMVDYIIPTISKFEL
ncbi:unnamed protein product [Cylicocyclus nassatus]|uniref:Uncharacterized protein n=1 Tax=Cylicocyclus nassatus TaxID=53992 RepID=A0AA36HD73_CYLNA|nr:unnamed protein product [Cylicocyclus nassatus]